MDAVDHGDGRQREKSHALFDDDGIVSVLRHVGHRKYISLLIYNIIYSLRCRRDVTVTMLCSLLFPIYQRLRAIPKRPLVIRSFDIER
jgi:hypothetical protein